MDYLESKKRGRKLTYGKFTSRGELVEYILWAYYETPQKVSDIARSCKVSSGVVDKIIATKV